MVVSFFFEKVKCHFHRIIDNERMDYMKKLIIIGILAFCGIFVKVPLYATEEDEITTPLVTNVGCDISSYLKYDGYIAISNTVNTAQEGCYRIIYKNINTLEEKEKLVYVTNQDTFFVPRSIQLKQSTNVTYEYLSGVKYNEQIAYLYRYKSPDYYGSHYYLYLNEHNSRIVMNNGVLNDAKLNYQNGTFLVVGTTNSSMDGSSSVFFKIIDQTSKQKTIDTGANEKGSSIACSDTYVFVAGKTDEVSETFPNKRDGMDAFIMFFNRSTLEVSNTLLIGGAGDDEIVDMYYLNHYLYALQTKGESTLRLLKIDLFGNIVAENQFNFNYGIKDAKLMLEKEKMYLSYRYYDYHYLDYVDHIDLVSEMLERTKIYEAYYALMKLVDYDWSDSGLLEIIMGFKNNQKGYCYQVYDDDQLLLSEYQNSDQTPKMLASGQLVSTFNSGYEITALNSVIVRQAPPTNLASSEEVLSHLQDNNILINLKQVPFDEASLINGIDASFGTYQNTYHYLGSIEYIRMQELKINPQIGAIDQGVYDVGLIIDGNASVRVNGELVTLPYQFNEVGTYQLELTGYQNEIVTLRIEIASLSTYQKELPPNQVMNVDLSPQTVNPEVCVNLARRTTENKVATWSFVVYLIPIMALGVGFLVLRRGK